MAGNDLRNMSDETKSILMNADVIAIDQDTAVKPVQLLTQQEKVEILERPLRDGPRRSAHSIAATPPPAEPLPGTL